MSDVTPMMRQYFEIKSEYPDTILFFRLGDFYEMFFDDAVKASRILDIALTSRNKNAAENAVPLCGIPYHACAPYLAKLIEAGEKVAICEQVEDPKTAKGIVRREVIRVVTPGMTIDSENLSPKENNYLLALYNNSGERWGLAYLDISTGEFRVTELTGRESVLGEIAAINPRELLLPEHLRNAAVGTEFDPLVDGLLITFVEDWIYDDEYAQRLFGEQFGGALPEHCGCAGLREGTLAAGAVLHYLNRTRQGKAAHIQGITPYRTAEFLVLDDSTRRNLELTATMVEGKRRGSLLGLMDRTATAMGGRKLKQWINYPLISIELIKKRQDGIEELFNAPELRRELTSLFAGIADLERLNGRISLASAGAKDIVALRESLGSLPRVLDLIVACTSPLLQELHGAIDPLVDAVALIVAGIVPDPPFLLRDGGIIADGYNDELDELRALSREGKGFIARLEASERTRTGISSLKVRYNKVFGYYIEVTKANLAAVPEDFIRKQTLVNAERFITPALKEYEEKVLGAEERISEIEYSLFQDIRKQIAACSQRIARTAESLATIDVLVALANLADDRNYRRPIVDESDVIAITDGRHPVIESMKLTERFVANDTLLDISENQLIIITGPNMAGKSTYMRQVALITLMAQMGSFVPAAEAQIGVVDRIFTRVGASDNLARGQSTFMVEMTETAAILRNATARSLIVLDEIGRGTSTFDGVSIAWAVAEHIHDTPACAARTLFATHYHEMTELTVTRSRSKNFNIAVREWNDQIIFLRKIVPGGASHSYGIQVARLAGLPLVVIERAKEILHNLEKGEYTGDDTPRIAISKKGRGGQPSRQLSLFAEEDQIRTRLKSINPVTVTPLEALTILHELCGMVP